MQTVNYGNYSERQLRQKLANIEAKEIKFENEILKIETSFKNAMAKARAKLEKTTQEKNFIKDAIMEKWRQPSENLLEAIKEVENGETTSYNSVDEMMKDLTK